VRIPLSLLALAACGGSNETVDASGPDGLLTCDRWSKAVIVAVPGASTGAKEASPTIAGDKGLLVFTSQPGALTELYALDYFGGSAQANHLDALDDGTDQISPRWNVAGTRLYWSRGGKLFSAPYTDGAFGTAAAEPGLSGETVASIAVSLAETELFYGDNADPTLSQLHYATRPSTDKPWAAQGVLGGGVNMGGDSSPALSHDQYTLYWESHRDARGRLYTAVRQQLTGDVFSQIEAFDELPGSDGDPDLSAHDSVFAYTANNNVYVATRKCM